MKINFNQIDQQLSQQQLANLFLVTGDEQVLVVEACDKIRTAIKSHGVDEREIFEVDKSFDWNNIYQLAGGSLFAKTTFVECHFKTATVNKELAGQINQLLSSNLSNITLLFVFPKLKANVLNSTWCKQIINEGCLVQIWPIPLTQWRGCVQTEARHLNIQIEPTAIDTLAKHTEGNLLAAKQILKHIQYAYTDQTVSTEDVQAIIIQQSQYDIFQFVDSLLENDPAKSLRMLLQLEQTGTEMTLVVWAIAKTLRELCQVSFQVKQGKAFAAAAQELGVWKTRQPMIQNCLQRKGYAQLSQYHAVLAKLDKANKGVVAGDSWHMLRQFCLKWAT